MKAHGQHTRLSERRSWIGGVSAVCFVLAALVSPLGAAAQDEMDLMVVLDLSGSMKSMDGLGRYDALFAWLRSFTASEDRIGVVAMGADARLLAPLTPTGAFSFDALRPDLKHRERFTDVAAGLESAYYQLKMTSRPEREKVILLYSDAEIDIPGGEWASRNAMRYLLERLNPAMKESRIRLMAIVPDGLKANFQLLHELSFNTGGVYYRGVPADANAVRAELTAARAPVEAALGTPTPLPDPSKALSVTPASLPAAAPVPAPQETPPRPKASPKPAISSRSAPVDASTPGWAVALFVVLGAVLVGIAAVLVLFRRRRRPPGGELSEIARLLDDVHALKKLTRNERVSRVSSFAPGHHGAVDSGLDFGEPSELLSVSLVSPFLDYADPVAGSHGFMDDIAQKPAFTEEDEETGANLSMAKMETLLGTPEADVEKQK